MDPIERADEHFMCIMLSRLREFCGRGIHPYCIQEGCRAIGTLCIGRAIKLNCQRVRVRQHTSLNNLSISHARQSRPAAQRAALCLSLKKWLRKSGLCRNDWRMTFKKHVAPIFRSPRGMGQILVDRGSADNEDGWLIIMSASSACSLALGTCARCVSR